MRECWINVYADYQFGCEFPSRETTEIVKIAINKIKPAIQIIYRIHVRMK